MPYEPNAFTPHQAGTAVFENWYAGIANQTAYGSGTATVGQVRAYPALFGRSGYIDRIGFETTVVGGAGSVSRVGIYRATSRWNVFPSSLVVDGGEKDTAASFGVFSTTVNIFLEAGWYWIATLVGTASPTFRRVGAGTIIGAAGINSTMGATPNRFYFYALAYGALPAQFSESPSITTDGALGHVRYST
jgi:hypothetical protein